MANSNKNKSRFAPNLENRLSSLSPTNRDTQNLGRRASAPKQPFIPADYSHLVDLKKIKLGGYNQYQAPAGRLPKEGSTIQDKNATGGTGTIASFTSAFDFSFNS